MTALSPYLNYPGTAEEAFTYYAEALGTEVIGIARFRDFGDAMGPLPEADLDKVANMALRLPDGSMMMATDVLESMGQEFRPGNNFSLHLEADDVAVAERIFAALSAGGKVNMEPGRTEWAQWFAGCTDKFGVEWMVSFTGGVVFGA